MSSRCFETIRGTFEYLPEKQILREKIKTTLENSFVKYGFAPVETPILSSYELLTSKYSEGADILNEMYTLSDRGKRSLGLRYDLTVAFCKLISSNQYIDLPFKRYEIGKVFRDGPVRVGRNREFTQCDVDMVGVKSMMAEAEYLTMAVDAYSKLGLDVVIKYNNRKLLNGIIECACGKVTDDINRKIIMLIDKFAKLTNEELRRQFFEIGITNEEYDNLRELLSLDYQQLREKLKLFESNTYIQEGLEELSQLNDYLEGTETKNYLLFAPYLARGIDIYTGTVWEVFLKNGIIESEKEVIDFTNTSIGGGGRYDKIITSFIGDGKEYPAVGMTFGLDVIYEVLTRMRGNTKKSVADLFIIPIGTEKDSFFIATKLRSYGVNVEIEKTSKRVKKSMDYANKMNIPYVCVIGSDELEKGVVSFKNMETGMSENFDIVEYEKMASHINAYQ